MNWIQNLLPVQLTQALGWTLIHSLWQGAALALLLAIALILLRKNSSKLRYFIASSALFTLVLASVVTFVSLYQTPASLTTYSSIAPKIGIAPQVSLAHTIQAQAPDKFAFFSDYFGQHLPLIVTIWLLGVLVLMLRFLGGYALLQRMRHHRVAAVNREWQLKILEIADHLKIKKIVRLLESANAKTPMVIGYLKPVILLPLGTISGLGSKQVESILAHEMAHIARNDYLVNILQSVVEIFLFFNPAMWWISGRVREEREHCCDDIALQLTNDHLTLVKTLATLEEMRIASPPAAVAFAGKKGGLVGRIRRIINAPRTNATFSEGFMAAILLVGFLFMGSFYMHTSPVNKPKPAAAKASSPELASLPGLASLPSLPTKPTTIQAPVSAAENAKDTIRFGKFMIVTNPRVGVLVFKNGKIISPDDYDKYENDFAINNEKIRIGKKGKNPIMIDIEPKKSYSNSYHYDSDLPAPPNPPSNSNVPLPPTPPSYHYDNDHYTENNSSGTWIGDKDGKQVEVRWRNGKITKLRINSKTIPSRDYNKYQTLIDDLNLNFNPPNYRYGRNMERYNKRMRKRQNERRQYQRDLERRNNRIRRQHQRTHNRHQDQHRRNMKAHNDRMRELESIIAKMKKDGIIDQNTRNYRLRIQDGYIKINGKTLNKKQYEEYRQFIINLTGNDIARPGSSWNWVSTHDDDD
ncbi:MAG TPA: hypothetical protein DCS93_08570 [Microscillaceae bacterium]|nr:hypothetical protein [Microscillaceae bacterium]